MAMAQLTFQTATAKQHVMCPLGAVLILIVGAAWVFFLFYNCKKDLDISKCLPIWNNLTSKQFCEKNEVTPHYKTNLRCYNREKDYGISSDVCLGYVVRGRDALPAEFPHQVYFASPKVKCGGTILNEHFILTAAHCFIRRDGKPRESAYTWKVVGGDTDLNSTEGTEQARSMSIIYTHPNYKPGTPYNDIALVKLKRPFILNNFLKAPLLPNEDFVLKFIQDSALSVNGYGDLSYQGVRPTKLQKTYLSIYTTFVCQAAYSNATIKLTDNIICAGGKGRDSCHGDFGGPLVFRRCDMGFYDHVLVGIVLGGIECGRERYPGMYTKVFKYTDWIQTSLGNTSIWGLTQGDCAQWGCCQNGGSCFVGTYSNSYSCFCEDGFKGLSCESLDEQWNLGMLDFPTSANSI